jgi:hypothetical protein
MFVFDSSVSVPSPHSRSPAARAVYRGAPRCHQTTRLEAKELGEIKMAHLAGAFRELLG